MKRILLIALWGAGRGVLCGVCSLMFFLTLTHESAHASTVGQVVLSVAFGVFMTVALLAPFPE